VEIDSRFQVLNFLGEIRGKAAGAFHAWAAKSNGQPDSVLLSVDDIVGTTTWLANHFTALGLAILYYPLYFACEHFPPLDRAAQWYVGFWI
jgi:hypothetical protein